MATSKVTNCFSKLSLKEFDTIEAAAQKLAASKGREQALNADYAEVVQGILTAKQAKLDALAKPQMSSNSKGAGRQNTGNTAANVVDAITSWMRVTADRLANKVTVVQSLEDLKGKVSDATYSVLVADLMDGGKAVAFTMNGHAYIIADRVQKGQERALFIHEVGAHLGLERLLPEKLYKHLVSQLQAWAAKDDGSIESKLAKRALERANEAETSAEDMDSEHLAYFLEEAIKAGVDPTAASGSFGEWLRSVYAAMKAAFRKLTGSTAELSPQDIVNLAYGAARLEVGGTWHGTAANFRKFDHSYMGSGEGAQAYGWGTYKAERRSIGKTYWKQDIARKTKGSTFVDANGVPVTEPGLHRALYHAMVGGVTIDKDYLTRLRDSYKDIMDAYTEAGPRMASDAKKLGYEIAALDAVIESGGVEYKEKFVPEGSLLRNDSTVQEHEMLDLDAKLDNQSPYVAERLAKIKQLLEEAGVLGDYEDAINDPFDRWTGKELIKKVLPRAFDDDVIAASSQEVEQALAEGNTPKAVSLYLDSLGIKGNRFLDAVSRDNEKYIVLNGKRYTKDDLKHETRNPAGDEQKHQFTTLRAVLRDGLAVVKLDYKHKVDEEVHLYRQIAKESYEKYFKEPYTAEMEQRDKLEAEEKAQNSYWAKQLQFLNENQISVEKDNVLRNHVIFNDKNIIRVATHPGADTGRIKFSKAAQQTDEANRAAAEARIRDAMAAYTSNPPRSVPPQAMNKLVESLPAAWRPAAFKVAQVLTGKAGDAINAVAFTEDLIDRAKGLGIQAADTYRKLVRQQSAVMGGHERQVQNIAAQYMGIEEENKGLGKGTANQFIHDSTMQGKWGYIPDHLKDTDVQVDPEMEKAFKALKPKAQAYVKAVFAYGYETMEAKKKAVLDSVPSIYDSLIAAEPDADAKQQLIDEKAAAIKQFGSMYRLGGNTPYAPLKRFGKYVVSAKSQQLLALQQMYETMQDGAERDATRKQIRQMEASAEHQFIDFVDNEYEARTVEEQLRQQGKFHEVQTRERNEASLYSGSGTLTALRAIEAKLNNEPDGKHKRAMLKMVGDMYLTALSEDSARRNELERVGVRADNADGTTRLDMQRAFESQGKADAFFLAHTAVGRGMQDVFKQMQNESNTGGDTRAKSSLYNELLLRRLQSLNYEDENWSHKMQRMASKYLLAFSPAYYLQNATQPWMVSLPIMAGSHDYTKAASILSGKYSQIASAVKEADLFSNLNYDKVLDKIKDPNERAFLKRALDEGIIDIGHGIDLAESSHYDSKYSRGWAKVDRSIRNLQQKAEAINRITTALTAYELEFGKTGDVKAAEAYAERIVRETHGDYSAWNAPRAFNTNIGRVALQFRKYQLVQLSLMARLIKNSFAGASKEERDMARKAFGLMLGQAFLVGGAKALPMLAVVPAVLASAFGSGAGEPPEYLFRQWVGNKEISDLLLNGMPTSLTGLNLSKFGGMGQMLQVLPFQDSLLPSDRSSVESFGYGLIGGPFGGLALRAADGASNIANGLWWKGLESFVPTGFANASKGIRYFVEGDANKRGGLNLAAEEFNMFTAAAQAIGIQPDIAARRMYEQQTKYAIETTFQGKQDKLKAEYVRARTSGDTAKADDVRGQWKAMMDAQRAVGVTPSELGLLEKAVATAKKNERQKQGTQSYTQRELGLGQKIANF